MKLSIGMATYDDYDGVYFTIQAIRTYHPEILDLCEFIVVDNNPGTKTSEYIQCLLDPHKMGKGIVGKYIPMAEPIGTTQSRNRIFTEATGDAVLVIDSHVLIAPGAIEELIAYYERHPQTDDLLSGPLLYDDFSLCGDHFDDFWRSQMWGIWGTGWTCCGSNRFTVLNSPNQICDFRKLSMGLSSSPKECPDCGQLLPYQLPYAHHQHQLINAKFRRLSDPHQPPFPIPGMGLGLFSCRRSAWLGFNPHFRGFGGEEMYIHEKFRQAGRQCLCLPFLRWDHRFGRPAGTPYIGVCTIYNKVRNYVLGLQELGLSIDPCYQHFVVDIHENKHPYFPRGQWHYLLEDPIKHSQPFYPKGISPPKNSTEPVSNTMQTMLGGSK